MKLKYHKNIVNMLYNEWDLGKKASLAKGKTCAWIYWLIILGESEKIIVEKVNDEIIGVCGYAKWHSKKHFLRKVFYQFLAKVLICSPFIKNKKALHNYLDKYEYVPDNLSNYFDGEVSILIVNELFRSKDIGKKLLLKVFELAKKENMKNLQILTDESCNYKFYQALNCEKVYERRVYNGENKFSSNDSEICFIYEKKLR